MEHNIIVGETTDSNDVKINDSKSTKYKTMLFNGIHLSETKSNNDLTNLDKFYLYFYFGVCLLLVFSASLPTISNSLFGVIDG